METEEQWKAVRGYEGYYEASSLGAVRSVSRLVNHPMGGKRSVRGRSIKLTLGKIGYYYFTAAKDGVLFPLSAHRAVALAFLPNPDNKPQVNHKNGVKSDNRLENLEWATSSENTQHGFDVLGRKSAIGQESHAAKLTDNDVREIRAWWKTGDVFQDALAHRWCVDQSLISLIVTGKIWKHLLPSPC